MHNVAMSIEHDQQERSYFVINDGVDAIGELSLFSTLTEAIEYAGSMEAMNNAVTVEIFL
jgi:hypothetical protein